ncbi:MAG: hypothetical protein A2091_10905 [Desulfuromonadales bacterium GWD2_61_12]|nr:MAG: hypothetical protein A2005_08230 [Desulfuromonadales bacterium GWC2_61_20]OGR32043.1 MAG: hypothetical protein A2091_10905 [Desulfuromonadales bacterium GWD2_61_12]HAD04739.1 hypothetical protein [Desulfuromonas sp.]HBT83126.1 hypothetical protein [Desulfuromonas sp.]
MLKISILILSIFSCAACSLPAATPQWRHADKLDSVQMQRASSDCHMYLDAAQESGASPPHRLVREWDDEFIRCMAERGWTPAQGPR